MNKQNYEFTAEVLAKAAASKTDKEAYTAYGVSRNIFYIWKKQLETDATLQHYVAHKKAELEKQWAHDATATIRESMAFLKRAAKEADHKDPEVIHAVAGAVKIVSEAIATTRYLDYRLNNADSSAVGNEIQQARQVHTSNTLESN